MQYLHQARYGNLGNEHTMKPQLVLKGNAVYATLYNKTVPAGQALFDVRGKELYATGFHPGGKSAHPLYEIRGDKIHTTSFHPKHNPSQHVFELRDSLH